MNKLRQCLFIFREHSASSLKLIMKTNVLVSTTKPLLYVLLLYNSDNNFKYVRTKYLQLILTEAIKKVEFKVFFGLVVPGLVMQSLKRVIRNFTGSLPTAPRLPGPRHRQEHILYESLSRCLQVCNNQTVTDPSQSL